MEKRLVFKGLGLFQYGKIKEKELEATPESLKIVSDALVEMSDMVLSGEEVTRTDLETISDALVEVSEMVLELDSKIENLEG